MLELTLPTVESDFSQSLDSKGLLCEDIDGRVDNSVGSNSQDRRQLQSPCQYTAKTILWGKSICRRRSRRRCRDHYGRTQNYRVVWKGVRGEPEGSKHGFQIVAKVQSRRQGPDKSSKMSRYTVGEVGWRKVEERDKESLKSGRRRRKDGQRNGW